MKVHILMHLQEGPYGGSHQFMKALRDWLRERDYYAETVKDAEICIFNAYLDLDKVIQARFMYPQKLFMHRVDGPMAKYNHAEDLRDELTLLAAEIAADGIIFQSNWSREQMYQAGMSSSKPQATILNSSNGTIYNRVGKSDIRSHDKIRLIASSWSKNIKKGFNVYKWLDENLDFKKYEMTFVGNTPFQFKNIKVLSPLADAELAKELKKNAIYITASECDPCSNSLIEALHCGLPAIALADGGHPEIVGRGGELFNYAAEIPKKISDVIKSYDQYQNLIAVPDMNLVGQAYIDAGKKFADLRSRPADRFGWFINHTPNFIRYLKHRYILKTI